MARSSADLLGEMNPIGDFALTDVTPTSIHSWAQSTPSTDATTASPLSTLASYTGSEGATTTLGLSPTAPSSLPTGRSSSRATSTMATSSTVPGSSTDLFSSSPLSTTSDASMAISSDQSYNLAVAYASSPPSAMSTVSPISENHHHRHNNLAIILGSILGALCLFLLAVVLFQCFRLRRRSGDVANAKSLDLHPNEMESCRQLNAFKSHHDFQHSGGFEADPPSRATVSPEHPEIRQDLEGRPLFLPVPSTIQRQSHNFQNDTIHTLDAICPDDYMIFNNAEGIGPSSVHRSRDNRQTFVAELDGAAPGTAVIVHHNQSNNQRDYREPVVPTAAIGKGPSTRSRKGGPVPVQTAPMHESECLDDSSANAGVPTCVGNSLSKLPVSAYYCESPTVPDMQTVNDQYKDPESFDGKVLHSVVAPPPQRSISAVAAPASEKILVDGTPSPYKRTLSASEVPSTWSRYNRLNEERDVTVPRSPVAAYISRSKSLSRSIYGRATRNRSKVHGAGVGVAAESGASRSPSWPFFGRRRSSPRQGHTDLEEQSLNHQPQSQPQSHSVEKEINMHGYLNTDVEVPGHEPYNAFQREQAGPCELESNHTSSESLRQSHGQGFASNMSGAWRSSHPPSQLYRMEGDGAVSPVSPRYSSCWV